MSTDRDRGYRRPETTQTMQVRAVRTSQRTCFYFADVTAQRAAQLAAEHCAAMCVQDVDYFEVFDGPYYGPSGDDELPLLVADWRGRSAITINTTTQV